MPKRKTSSHREDYPYDPIYHVDVVTNGSDGSRIAATTSKYPSGQTVCFRIVLDKPDMCLVTDDGAIVNQLGKERDYAGLHYFDDAQIEHWHALNYIFKTNFGEGPDHITSIEAGAVDRVTALYRIIGAARNFIAAEVKGR